MSFDPKEFNPEIADFSMEVFLKSSIPTYSGGLGVLEGDVLRSCADLRVPIVGIAQVSSNGYFRQKINEKGEQIEEEIHWEPRITLGRIEEKATIKNRGRDLYVGASPFVLKGETEFRVPVYLITTDLEENLNEDRSIAGTLYDADDWQRISQENVLGQGGVKLLRELGYSPRVFRLNEGHAAFSTLALLAEGKSEEEVRKLCVFTTHTPVPAGNKKYSYSIVENTVGELLPSNIRELAGREEYSSTLLASNLSSYINAVSKRHREVCKRMEIFKGREIDYVTNGIHPKTWACEQFKELFDSHFRHWTLFPEVLGNSEHISDAEILEAKKAAKTDLILAINSSYPVKLDLNYLTVVWARRFTEYKRPGLLIRDKDRLEKTAEKLGGLQIIYAGKSHPKDDRGKELIQETWNFSKKTGNKIRCVFLENYNPDMAKMLLGGADIWLNTPRRPLEASGTSGMKAALNGCLSLSTYEGWVVEGYEMAPEAIWLVGEKKDQFIETDYREWEKEDEEDAKIMYNNLEEIMEVFKNEQELARRIKKSISLVSYFNTHRVVKELYGKLLNRRI